MDKAISGFCVGFFLAIYLAAHALSTNYVNRDVIAICIQNKIDVQECMK